MIERVNTAEPPALYEYPFKTTKLPCESSKAILGYNIPPEASMVT
jgi:hypothetical protein